MSDLIIKGPVTIPGEIDLTNDRALTAEEIQKAAFDFVSKYNGLIDVQHSFERQAELVESYIAPEDTTFNDISYPAGTWFISARVSNPDIIKAIESNELTGFSIGALPSKQYDELKRDLPISKGAFSDVAPGDWFPLAVSIVDLPAMEKATFKVFTEDEFIKKSYGEDKMSKEELQDTNALAGVVTKLIDVLIKKEDIKEEEIEKAEPPVKDEEPKYVTMEQLKEAIDEIKAMIGKEEPIEKEAEAEEVTEEEEVIEKSEESEEVVEEESEVISKSLPVDKTHTKPESFNKRIGRDAFGRKI